MSLLALMGGDVEDRPAVLDILNNTYQGVPIPIWYAGASINKVVVADNKIFTLSTTHTIRSADLVDFSVNALSPNTTYNTQVNYGGYGIAFNNDGTKAYFSTGSEKAINEVILAVPYNCDEVNRTLSYKLDCSANVTTTGALTFSDDGTKLFVNQSSGVVIYTYTLSTPYLLSSAVYTHSTTLPGATTSVYNVQFLDGGTKCRSCGSSSGIYYLIEYTLDTPWDLSSISSTVTNGSGPCTAVVYSADGTKGLFAVNNYVYSMLYTSVSQTSFLSASLNSPDIAPIKSGMYTDVVSAIFANSDGTKICVKTNANIFCLSLSESFNLSSITAKTYPAVPVTGVVSSIYMSPDGLYYYSTSANLIYQRALSVAWDMSTLSSTTTASITSPNLATTFSSIDFSSDGTRLFAFGSGNDTIETYELTTPWMLSSRLVSSTTVSMVTSISSKESTSTGVVISPDGTKLYVSGSASDSIHQYNLSTAYDLGTAVFYGSKSISAQATMSSGLTMSYDGTKAYFCDTNTFNMMTLSTAWDITTAAYISEKTAPASGTSGIWISPDGSVVISNNTSTVYKGSLSVPYDITSYTLDTSRAISDMCTPAETAATGICMSNDGLHMYIIGTSRDALQSFTLSTPFDITTAVQDIGTASNLLTIGVSAVSDVSMSSDGKYFFVACSGTDKVYRFETTVPYYAHGTDTNGYPVLMYYEQAQPNVAGIYQGENITRVQLLKDSNHLVGFQTAYLSATVYTLPGIQNASNIVLRDSKIVGGSAAYTGTNSLQTLSFTAYYYDSASGCILHGLANHIGISRKQG